MEEDIKVINLSFVNAFLVKIKGGFALIDTGLSRQWEKLEKILISEGCLPNKLKIVILTHGDGDHIGNAKKLGEKYKVKIAIHKADYNWLESGEIPKRKVKAGFMKVLLALFLLFRKNKADKNLFKADLFLKDNESLKKYGFDAKVIHTPGHSSGSVVILTKGKNLFAGDTLENRKKPKTAQIIENEDDLKNSLKKIKKLDIKMVYPGHGKPFLMKDLN
jgi:glyoxylase-like metal-dependent hydrolase (beta-lactamase superfamily II)